MKTLAQYPCYLLRMETLGRHVLAELYGCDEAAIDDRDTVARAMRAAAEAVGATVVAESYHRYAPLGISGVMLIAESHLSVHSWPEAGYAAVDIYTCGDLDPNKGVVALAEVLGSTEVVVQEIRRGTGGAIDLVP